jgi:uncharacterized protein YggE
MLTFFQKSLLATVALGAILVALVVAAKAPAQATTVSAALPVPAGGPIPAGIVTTGDAIVRVKPDGAFLGVGAVAQGATAGEAQDLLAQRIDALVQRARTLGIADADTKTAIYRIDPQYAYEQGKPPRLTGYQGTQQLVLTLHGTDGVGKALDALVGGDGATNATVTFTLLDPKPVQAAARAQAIQDARGKAEAMAKTAAVSLGKVVSVNDIGLAPTVDSTTFSQLVKSAQPAPAAIAPQLPTGELQVSVRVQVQFEIGG